VVDMALCIYPAWQSITRHMDNLLVAQTAFGTTIPSLQLRCCIYAAGLIFVGSEAGCIAGEGVDIPYYCYRIRSCHTVGALLDTSSNST
jgi:hypothetical protein